MWKVEHIQAGCIQPEISEEPGLESDCALNFWEGLVIPGQDLG